MIRVLLVDPSSDLEILRWCEQDDELTLSLLPEKTVLLEALTRQKYDIVIVHDPSADSPALSIPRQIRTFNTVIPVVFLTDTLDAGRAATALNTGADYYLWGITGENCQNLLVPVIKNLVRHRRIDEQIIQDNMFMRAIHDASPIAACVIKDHRILWVNAIIPKKLGYTESELIGSDPIHLFPTET